VTTNKRKFSFSRHAARGLQFSSRHLKRGRGRPSREGAGNAGCPMHPWFGQKMPGSCHRFTGLNRHSLRDGFTVSFVLSPATGLCCHRRPWEVLASQKLDASNGASGPHDFAVRFNAVRPRAKKRVTTPKRPPHPAPTFVTTADAPLTGQDGFIKVADLPPRSSNRAPIDGRYLH
jgi:hypothetical protein